MNTNALKKFAREARIKLLDLIGRKLEYVLTADTAELRGQVRQIEELKKQITRHGKNHVIETVAYTWFNRLMALRFMDAKGYTSPKVVSPEKDNQLPEILQEAKAGNIATDLNIDKQRLNDLLDGKTSVSDSQTEAYKLLLVATCNYWYTAMPFMFERISDFTELLLPDDLLSDYSIISDIRNGISEEDCKQEEIIGWLYQFYIADKKDEVFDGLKKNIKITAENIPAATQLFTPRWIVRYMVENTLGKLWFTLKPNSKLRQHMPYYIEVPEVNTHAPLPEGIKGVTDITFLDPCQGSGHVLVYAFDLFTKIYEEEGYNTNEIPALILEHNLFGIDIDERAAQLAAFALSMKARSYYPRFLRKPIQPHVIALENVNDDIIKQAVKLPLAVAGKLIYDHRDLTLYNLTQADNFGSLIQIDPEELKALQIQKGSIWQEQEQKLKEQAEYLSRQYHCVVTNPPYMGNKGMNGTLRSFVETYYPSGKEDLMTSFMIRCGDLIYKNCSYAMINLPSWLFLISFEEQRKYLLKHFHIESMLHMGRGIFGIDFGSAAFVLTRIKSQSKGIYFRLHQRNFQHIYFQHIEQLFLRSKENPSFKYCFEDYRDEVGISEIPFQSDINGKQIYFQADQEDFAKMPGSPIGYWVGVNTFNAFINNPSLETFAKARIGMMTTNNVRFVRQWQETSLNNIGFGLSSIEDSIKSKKRWFPYNKGGDYRKWYGNNELVVNWKNEGEDIRNVGMTSFRGKNYYFKEGVTWSSVSSRKFCVRYKGIGSIFDIGGSSSFPSSEELYLVIAFLCGKVANHFLSLLNPTLNYQANNINSLPFINKERIDSGKFERITELCLSNIEINKDEWNIHETSWEFKGNELINQKINFIEVAVKNFIKYWQDQFYLLHRNEQELNSIFIEIYDLGDILTSDVPIDEITFLQEESKIIDNELQIEQLAIIQQLLSYSTGCLLGRYGLNKQGLILANQGETLQDFLKQVPNPTFMPDEDNIIPVLEGEWFADDIVGKFKVFLKAAFSGECLEENLKYIEDTIGKDIRKYFVKDFYTDHIKRYKKRPIYWMFSSPKGHFKALIYMHRYTPDLCNKLLNDYLRAFISKLESEKQRLTNTTISESASTRERTIATKKIAETEAMLKDLRQYEKTLFEIAAQKIEIDLDDGVKVNYQKFKDVLVPIKGLEKEEE